jgi:hypothetical protein
MYEEDNLEDNLGWENGSELSQNGSVILDFLGDYVTQKCLPEMSSRKKKKVSFWSQFKSLAGSQ